MARLAFQQHELNLTVFVQVPVRVSSPVFRDQIALDNTGLFGISTDVEGFVIAVQRFAGWLFVEEYDWHILATRFLNHCTCCCRVNQVNGQGFHTFRQQNVDLVVLFGLVVLGVIHQQLNIWRCFSIFLDSFTHNRHEVVVVFIDCHTNTGIRSVRSRTKKHACHNSRQSQNLLIHGISGFFYAG
ncbi:hypothetical protein D3C75_716540 [compost metagenome]